METRSQFQTHEQPLLRSLMHSGVRFYLWVAGLGGLFLLGVYAYTVQLREGLAATAMRDYVSWGLYITNFVFFIGISHVGALMSAILRISGAGWRRPITRMAEAITFSSLFFGALMPIVDLGRPDRMLNLLFYPRIQSPIVWDFVCIFTYLMGSTIFLYLPMIPDLALLRDELARSGGWRQRLYAILSLGWRGTPEQHRRLERAMSVMAVIIIPIAVSVHTVVSWIFAMTLRPGWNSTIFGPYFVMGALVSGAAAVILAMAAFRRLYHLEEFITLKHFRNMALLTLTLALLYIYFNVSEYLTVGYKMEEAERGLLYSLLGGEYAIAFWFVQLGGLVIPVLLFILPEVGAVELIRRVPILKPVPLAAAASLSLGAMVYLRSPMAAQADVGFGSLSSALSWVALFLLAALLVSVLPLLKAHRIAAYVLGAGLIVIQAWLKRYLIIVPTLLAPYLPIQDPRLEWTTYIPTWVEWSITLGAMAGFVLLYTLFSKLFPIVSIWETRESELVPSAQPSPALSYAPSYGREPRRESGSMPKVFLLLLLGVLLGLVLTAALIFAPSAGAHPNFQDPPPDPEQLYAENCAACHGERGEGRAGPALTHLDDHSDDEIYHTIAEGRPERGMPAWGDRLAPAEITALVGYLRQLGSETPGPATQEPAAAQAPGASLDLALTLDGEEVVARAILREESGQPMAGEEIAFALRTTLGGLLPLGTFPADAEGIATLRYPIGEAPSLTLEVSYPPEAQDPLRAVASIDLPAGQEIPPVPTGFFSPNPPPIAILLLGLVVGGVWLTYAWVGWQLLGIMRSKGSAGGR